jgi:hypothetical protein
MGCSLTQAKGEEEAMALLMMQRMRATLAK